MAGEPYVVEGESPPDFGGDRGQRRQEDLRTLLLNHPHETSDGPSFDIGASQSR